MTKKEQLRIVFRNILYEVFGKHPGLIDNPTKLERDYIEKKTNEC